MKTEIVYSCIGTQRFGEQKCVSIYDIVSVQDNQLHNGKSIMLECIFAFSVMLKLTVQNVRFF